MSAPGPSQPSSSRRKIDVDEDYLPSGPKEEEEDELSSSYSDLDDDADDSEGYSSKKKSKTKNSTPKRPEKGFLKEAGLIKGALKPYMPVQYSTQHLTQLIDLGDIELNPDYQRDVVWPQYRMEGLLDSLFHNYYVPPVLFAVKAGDDGLERRTCIDGKQRLTTIYLFMTGSIPWRPTTGSGKGKKYWYKLPAAYSRSKVNLALPPTEKRIFSMKMIQCAEFSDIPESAERDIFQRVQLGMALSAAEKLQAMTTPFVQYINMLLAKYIFAEDYGLVKIYDKWEQGRGRAFQNVAIMLQMIEAYPERRTNVGAPAIHTWLNRVDEVEDGFRRKIDEVFSEYVEIFKTYKAEAIDAVPNKLAPIEFTFLGVMIYACRETFSLAEIAALFGTLRVYIRQFDANIRSNTRVISELYNFLDSTLKQRKRGRTAAGLDDDDDLRKRQRQEERLDGDYVQRGGIRPGDHDLRNTRNVNYYIPPPE